MLNRIRNKKGFGLVECVIALLLFSIVTASVFSVYSTSRRHTETQNDGYKIDLMASNILAAYEGSNTSRSFSNSLETLGIELADVGTPFSQTIGEEGTGHYSFETDNVPLAVPYSKVIVKGGAASFIDKDGAELVKFNGGYSDNKLQNVDDYSWDSCFTETEKLTDCQMKISGRVYISGGVGYCNYTYTVHYNGKTELTCVADNAYGTRSGSKNASEFENYLLKNGYYLNCIYRSYEPAGINVFATTYDYFYFQVLNAADGSPVKKDGKCLFYKITVATNDEYDKYTKDLQYNIDKKEVNMFMDFNNLTAETEKKGSIQYGYADEGTAYNKIEFNDTLKNESGNYFTGKWYYFPWLLANTAIDEGTPNITVSCSDYVPLEKYHEYTPKSGTQSDIFYALNSTKNNKMMLFNSEDREIFAYKGVTATPLEALKTNPLTGFGKDGKRNTLAVYKDETYDKWYKKGAVPLWLVTKVTFTDGGEHGVSKITFYGKTDGGISEGEYITFSYLSYDDYKADRDSIIDYYGDKTTFYDYTKTYSNKSLKNITDETGLAPYKQLDKIKEKNLGTTSEETNLLYYKVSDPKYDSKTRTYNYTYTYYSYKITKTTSISLTNYKENAHTLTIERSGDTVTCTEVIDDSATVRTTYTYTITAVDKGTETVVETGSISEPSTPPDALKNGTRVDDFSGRKPFSTERYDYSDKDWVLNDFKKGKPTGSSDETVTGLVGNSTYSVIPSDLDASWNKTSTDNGAVLHTEAKLFSLAKNEGYYDLAVDGEKTVFTAHTGDFAITAGDITASDSDCIYDILGGEKADIYAETFFISWTSGDTTLIAKVIYSNFTKEFEFEGEMMSYEPKITIWSVPKDRIPTPVENITGAGYDRYLYRSYRKG